MKTRIACSVVVSLLLIVGLAAAGEEKEPEKLVLLHEFAVHPEGIAQFEASLKALHGPLAEHGLDYGWDVYSTDDMRYVLTIWVEGLAGIEAVFSKWEAFGERWGEESIGEWYEGFSVTFDHSKRSVWHPRPDLSYMPENSPKENDFFYWGVLTVKPGHMKAVEKAFQTFVKLMTEHEVAHAWNAAVGGIGTEGPTVAYLEWGASPGAFFSRVDAINANEELMKATGPVWEEMLPHLRGYEYVTGKYRKDLSWHPEKEGGVAKE